MKWSKRFWNKIIGVALETLGISVIGIGIGIIAHQSDRYIKAMPRGDTTKQIVRYVIGIIASLPLFGFVIWWRVGLDSHEFVNVLVAYLLTFASVGLGVILGHWHDLRRR